jgi:hypothetical protein
LNDSRHVGIDEINDQGLFGDDELDLSIILFGHNNLLDRISKLLDSIKNTLAPLNVTTEIVLNGKYLARLSNFKEKKVASYSYRVKGISYNGNNIQKYSTRFVSKY